MPEGKLPGDELTRYRRYLKVESHRLQILHRGGGAGWEVCHGRSVMMDELLRHLMISVEKTLPETGKKTPPFALIAYGGYGRGELNPHSDIDILFLHDGKMIPRGKPLPYLEALLGPGGMLYTLIDIPLKVGHAVRTIAECVELARHDVQTKTALIESRLIVGDDEQDVGTFLLFGRPTGQRRARDKRSQEKDCFQFHGILSFRIGQLEMLAKSARGHAQSKTLSRPFGTHGYALAA